MRRPLFRLHFCLSLLLGLLLLPACGGKNTISSPQETISVEKIACECKQATEYFNVEVNAAIKLQEKATEKLKATLQGVEKIISEKRLSEEQSCQLMKETLSVSNSGKKFVSELIMESFPGWSVEILKKYSDAKATVDASEINPFLAPDIHVPHVWYLFLLDTYLMKCDQWVKYLVGLPHSCSSNMQERKNMDAQQLMRLVGRVMDLRSGLMGMKMGVSLFSDQLDKEIKEARSFLEPSLFNQLKSNIQAIRSRRTMD